MIPNYISAEKFALAHYYLKHIKGETITDEKLLELKKRALLHMPEDQCSLLRRLGNYWSEDDFSDEIKEIAHYVQKEMKNKMLKENPVRV
jgi:hypothetical protein